jgi:hypothetical protein
MSPMGKLVLNNVYESIIYINGIRRISLVVNLDEIVDAVPFSSGILSKIRTLHCYAKRIGVDSYSNKFPYLR